MLLPFSQLHHAGFIASLRDDFREVFHEFKVQLPLQAGDVAFFNPAVFHGAGANVTTDFLRMNNLLQVSSAFGRTMETMNTDLTALAVYPYLLEIEDPRTLENVIAAACEGYAFPTNLDLDPPLGGLAPPSQTDLVHTAVAERWPIERLRTEFAARNDRRRGLEQ
jgi:ectoine hydroxylase-related dioxygenase (phytanoyl-CoA dioxygenase family)